MVNIYIKIISHFSPLKLFKKKKKKESAMQETKETEVRSLGWGDPLEEEMTTHSSIPAQRILWIEEPGGLRSMGS